MQGTLLSLSVSASQLHCWIPTATGQACSQKHTERVHTDPGGAVQPLQDNGFTVINMCSINWKGPSVSTGENKLAQKMLRWGHAGLQSTTQDPLLFFHLLHHCRNQKRCSGWNIPFSVAGITLCESVPKTEDWGFLSWTVAIDLFHADQQRALRIPFI